MGLVTAAFQEWACFQANKKLRHKYWMKPKMMLMKEEASSNEMCLSKFESLHHRQSQADEEICLKKVWMRGNYWKASADACLLYTSPSPRDRQKSRMPSSA